MLDSDRSTAILATAGALLSADPAPVGIFDFDGAPDLLNPVLEAHPAKGAILAWMTGAEARPILADALGDMAAQPCRIPLDDGAALCGRLSRVEMPGLGARCQLRLQPRDASDRPATTDRSYSRLVGALSHEMRTPITGIVANTDLLRREGGLTARQSDLLRIIESSALGALNQMNSALAFSRGDDSAYRIEPSDFLPGEILRDVADQQGAAARRKGLALNVTFAGDPALRLHGAAPHLFTVLQNLLSNAIKFTQHGEIALSMHVHAPENGCVALEVSVSDTGIGIPQDRADRIFELFDTGAPHHDVVAGAGLGLPIVRRALAALDGQIVLDSQPGRGTRFDVACTFPIGLPVQLTLDPLLDGAEIEGKHVLVADDNDINREVLAALLRARGLRVTLAPTGQQAVAAVNGAEPRDFDLVIMDLGLPDIDGIEAARRIAALPGNNRLPIVGLTAWLDAAIEARCLLVGMTHVVEKPLRDTDIPQLFGQIGGCDPQPLRRRAINDLVQALARVANDIELDRPELAADATHQARGFIAALGFDLLSRELRDLETMLRLGAADPMGQLVRIRTILADMQMPELHQRAQTPWIAITA